MRVEIEDTFRRELSQAMVEAAAADQMELYTNGIAFAGNPRLSVVSAPVAGLETLDFKAILDGRYVLQNTPVMYWYLAGEPLGDRPFPFSDGFYSVVADQQSGIIALRNRNGESVAKGGLDVCIEPPLSGVGPRVAKKAAAGPTVSGKITSVTGTWWPPHIKVCGQVTIKQSGVTVKVKACIDAGF